MPRIVLDAGNKLINGKDIVPDFIKQTLQAVVFQCEKWYNTGNI